MSGCLQASKPRPRGNEERTARHTEVRGDKEATCSRQERGHEDQARVLPRPTDADRFFPVTALERGSHRTSDLHGTNSPLQTRQGIGDCGLSATGIPPLFITLVMSISSESS